MCLAVPAKVLAVNANRTALVDILGIQREVAIDLVSQAKVDDYVLIHAGFAIEVVSAEAAQETLALLREFPELAGDI